MKLRLGLLLSTRARWRRQCGDIGDLLCIAAEFAKFSGIRYWRASTRRCGIRRHAVRGRHYWSQRPSPKRRCGVARSASLMSPRSIPARPRSSAQSWASTTTPRMGASSPICMRQVWCTRVGCKRAPTLSWRSSPTPTRGLSRGWTYAAARRSKHEFRSGSDHTECGADEREPVHPRWLLERSCQERAWRIATADTLSTATTTRALAWPERRHEAEALLREPPYYPVARLVRRGEYHVGAGVLATRMVARSGVRRWPDIYSRWR